MIACSRSTRSWLASLAALAAVGALAAPAAAQAPDYKFALSSATPEVKWDGTSTVSANVVNFEQTGGVRCGKTTVDYCEHALFEVQQPGRFSLLGVNANAVTDVDFYIFRSDAEGKPGTQVESPDTGNPPGEDEVFATTVAEPGFYLLRVAFYTTFGASYSATASFEVDPDAPPLGGPPPPPGPGPTPSANAAPKSVISSGAKSAKASKVKSFSGTASDTDGSVAKVEIALIRVKGDDCQTMTSSGTFKPSECSPPKTFVAAKGTTKWSYKLKKKLKKAKYVLYSRAVDNAGLAESQWGSKNRKQFTVR
jgi:hypothetical protein